MRSWIFPPQTHLRAFLSREVTTVVGNGCAAKLFLPPEAVAARVRLILGSVRVTRFQKSDQPSALIMPSTLREPESSSAAFTGSDERADSVRWLIGCTRTATGSPVVLAHCRAQLPARELNATAVGRNKIQQADQQLRIGVRRRPPFQPPRCARDRDSGRGGPISCQISDARYDLPSIKCSTSMLRSTVVVD